MPASADLLESEAEALVNPVNTVGVMGRGLALRFKLLFPENYRIYREACKQGQMRPGSVLTTRGDEPNRYVINFATKKHWRDPSQLHWIGMGLADLSRTIRELGIRSVAVPKLGCGNGGLPWEVVRPLIRAIANELPEVTFEVYGEEL